MRTGGSADATLTRVIEPLVTAMVTVIDIELAAAANEVFERRLGGYLFEALAKPRNRQAIAGDGAAGATQVDVLWT